MLRRYHVDVCITMPSSHIPEFFMAQVSGNSPGGKYLYTWLDVINLWPEEIMRKVHRFTHGQSTIFFHSVFPFEIISSCNVLLVT